MENTITLYSISELLERNFFVPSYQRGYRWTKQQVEDLLNDIYAFAIQKKEKNEFYCLQPIVVKPHKWDRTNPDGSIENIDGWELVDGQQRLTTIKILLSYFIKTHLTGKTFKERFNKEVFSIDYETRSDSEYFLNNIVENDNTSIDFFHISKAYSTIENWVKEKVKKEDVMLDDICDSILRTLVYNMNNQKSEGVLQVIWYQIEDGKNPIDTFIRINLGKISLTNSELIKALFLQESNFGEDKNDLAKLRQLEIANEWDRIENTLQDENFWWFLNKGENKKPSRIEFIFDLICAVEMKHNPGIVESIGTDKYATFRYFYQMFEGKNNFDFIKTQWATVTDYFNTFLEWYNNPVWYHYIGFLIYCDENIVELFDLTHTNSVSKEDITIKLEERVKFKFKDVNWKVDEDNLPYLDLSYAKTKQKNLIRQLLLLLNIKYIIEQCNSKSIIFKFPFKSFKEENWDVEHIDSFTENPLNDRATQIEWLITAKNDLPELGNDLILSERIKLFIEDDKSKESFELIQGEIIRIAGEDTNDTSLKNNIGNLTLLDEKTNRSYGNALFPTKRRIIIEKDMKGTFIPIWTKNLFLKYFDLQVSSRTKWNETDIKKYRNIIAESLESFLPPKP